MSNEKRKKNLEEQNDFSFGEKKRVRKTRGTKTRRVQEERKPGR